MKKSLLLLLAFMAIFSCGISAASSVVERNGRLAVSGSKIVNEAGEPVQLRGVSMGWHCLWPRFYTTGTVARLANDWGADVVRCSIGLDLGDISFDKRPELAYALVDSIVKGAVDNGVYALIDFHSHENNKNLAKEFFATVSKRYGHLPNVMYEIWNEPLDIPWSEIKDYAAEIIPVIRENAPEAVVVVGTPRWDQEIQLAAEDPIGGVDNIVYALHFYAATHGEWLRERAQAAVDSGLPVFISECAAMEASGDGPIDEEEWSRWIDFANRNQTGWIAWSVSDKLETCSMLEPTAASDGTLWTDDDIKPWGQMVRRWLRLPPTNQ